MKWYASNLIDMPWRTSSGNQGIVDDVLFDEEIWFAKFFVLKTSLDDNDDMVVSTSGVKPPMEGILDLPTKPVRFRDRGTSLFRDELSLSGLSKYKALSISNEIGKVIDVEMEPEKWRVNSIMIKLHEDGYAYFANLSPSCVRLIIPEIETILCKAQFSPAIAQKCR